MSAKEYLAGQQRTALYLRVSTADQKPDLQYDSLRCYAERAGLNVMQDYRDIVVSGRREERSQLNALIAAARNREIECVVFEHALHNRTNVREPTLITKHHDYITISDGKAESNFYYISQRIREKMSGFLRLARVWRRHIGMLTYPIYVD